jgi:hypothetical protein
MYLIHLGPWLQVVAGSKGTKKTRASEKRSRKQHSTDPLHDDVQLEDHSFTWKAMGERPSSALAQFQGNPRVSLPEVRSEKETAYHSCLTHVAQIDAAVAELH